MHSDAGENGGFKLRIKYTHTHPVSLHNFEYEFQSGKSYLLNGRCETDLWDLSYLISGRYSTSGFAVWRDDEIYTAKQRLQDVWLVRSSEIKRFGLFRQPLQAQIQHGLRSDCDSYFQSEAEFIKHFKLTSGRYRRLLTQFSSEGYSASCAVGLANGRRIFCFNYMRPEFIAEYREGWFEEQIDILKAAGSIVIYPSYLNGNDAMMFDEVINF